MCVSFSVCACVRVHAPVRSSESQVAATAGEEAKEEQTVEEVGPQCSRTEVGCVCGLGVWVRECRGCGTFVCTVCMCVCGCVGVWARGCW